ncbi:MAG: polymer-forming cytoskeletal protein [Acidobacteriia bacterium]|nr:polymer-forming cytoskeletal protein [Terriglobia bacterium]
MWNKRTEDTSTYTPTSRPEEGATGNYASPVNARPDQPNLRPVPPRQAAVIGPSMTIKGEIRAREEVLVDGEVDGSVESQSLVTVGKNGKVKANIKAREVIVFGSVSGNIEVTEKIAIRENGSVIGDIKTAGISIDDGAYFKGSIDIVRPEPKAAPKPAPVETPAMSAASR